MADEFMHARTMTLLELGCPPLPIADGVRMETADATIINSHDLLSVFMTQAFKGQDAKRNEERKERQKLIEDSYYQQLSHSDGSFTAVYTIMAEYTRNYLGTFLLPPFSTRDVRVLPEEYISPALKAEISGYTSALQIVHGEVVTEEKRSVEANLKIILKILLRKEEKSKNQSDSTNGLHPPQVEDDEQSPQTTPDENPNGVYDDTESGK